MRVAHNYSLSFYIDRLCVVNILIIAIIHCMSKSFEAIKDLGKKMIGTDEGSQFQEKIQAYAQKYNIPPDQARKRVFMEYLQYAKDEVGSRKAFERGSGGMKSFEAALRELTGGAGIDMLKKTAKQRALTQPKQFVNTTPKDQQAVEQYYQQNYKKKPKQAVLRDSAEGVKNFDALLEKFRNDPKVANNPDIMSALLDPDLGGDIGQALLEHDMFEKHERRFESKMKFDNSMESFKKSGIETLKTVFGKPLGDFVGSGYRFARDPSIAGAARVGWEGTKYAAKTLTKGGKFLFNTVRTTLSGANAFAEAVT